MMIELTKLQAAYLVPSALREVSAQLDFLGLFCVQLEQVLMQDAPFSDPTASALPILQNFDLGQLRAVWHPWEF